MTFRQSTEEYYQKFIELQEKLRSSEEERLKLEMKFNEMLQVTREEEQQYYRRLRSQYKQFLEENKRRQERNERILRLLERIESRAAILEAKTQRFQLLRKHYQSYINRVYTQAENYKPPEVHARPLPEKPEDLLEKYLRSAENRRSGFTLPTENTIADEIMQSIYSRGAKNSFNRGDYISDRGFPSDYTRVNLPRASNRPTNQDMPDKEVKNLSNGLLKDDGFGAAYGDDVHDFDAKSDMTTAQPEITLSMISPEEETPKNILASQNGLGDNILGSQHVGIDEKSIVDDIAPKVMDEVKPIAVASAEESIEADSILKNGNEVVVPSVQEDAVPVEENLHYEPQKEDVNALVNVNGELDPSQTNLEMMQIEEDRSSKLVDENPNIPSEQMIEPQTETTPQLIEDNNMTQDGQEIPLDSNVVEYDQNQKQEVDAPQYEEQGGLQYDAEPVQYDETQQPETYQYENQSQQQYDENGQPQQQYDENGQPQQQYDENGQAVYNPPENNQNNTQFDENAQPYDAESSHQNEPAQYDQTNQQYDENGQPIYAPTLEYDENGQPIYQQQEHTQFDANGQPINYNQNMEYDENGQPIQYDPNQQYDENGQPIYNTDANQQQYDENGKPYEYDASGQPVYDENNQVIDQTNQQYYENEPAAAAYDPAQAGEQQYDEQGQPIYQQYEQPQQQYDENGQAVDYDENGQPIYYDESQSVTAQDTSQVSFPDSEAKTVEDNGDGEAKKPNVLELLETDSESTKQDVTKESNDSDFDFSKN